MPGGGRDVRWVRLDGLHLTLRFLGPTLEDRIEPAPRGGPGRGRGRARLSISRSAGPGHSRPVLGREPCGWVSRDGGDRLAAVCRPGRSRPGRCRMAGRDAALPGAPDPGQGRRCRRRCPDRGAPGRGRRGPGDPRPDRADRLVREPHRWWSSALRAARAGPSWAEVTPPADRIANRRGGTIGAEANPPLVHPTGVSRSP